MMADTIWDILGISPTSDKRAIKKAYAAKCGSCQGTGGHPRYLPAGGAGHGAGVKRLMQ